MESVLLLPLHISLSVILALNNFIIMHMLATMHNNYTWSEHEPRKLTRLFNCCLIVEETDEGSLSVVN